MSKDKIEIEKLNLFRNSKFLEKNFPKITIDIYGVSGLATRLFLPDWVSLFAKKADEIEEILKSFCNIVEGTDLPVEYKKNIIRGIIESGYYVSGRVGMDSFIFNRYECECYNQILTEEYKKERKNLENLIYDIFMCAVNRMEEKQKLGVTYEGESKYNGISKWVLKGEKCATELWNIERNKYIEGLTFHPPSYIDLDNMVVNALEKEIKYYENIMLNKTNNDSTDEVDHHFGKSYSMKRPKED